jgi:disulfide oxidoreductase YuzD
MYHFYNPSALEQEKNILRQVEANKPNVGSNLSNMMVFFKNYITIFNQPSNYQNLKTNLQKIVNRKIMTPLVSTTERVVDMVLSVKYFIKSKD